MSELVSLTFQTTPSTMMGIDTRPMHAPYRRILAIEGPYGDVECLHAVPVAQQSSETMQLPRLLAERLTTSVRAHLAGYDPESVVARQADNNSYNCHRTALELVGVHTANTLEALHFAEALAAVCRTAPHPLALGQYGALRIARKGPASWRLVHSLIGLGEDNPECLQAFFTGSNIGFASYDNVRASHGQNEPPTEFAALPQSVLARMLGGVAAGVALADIRRIAHISW